MRRLFFALRSTTTLQVKRRETSTQQQHRNSHQDEASLLLELIRNGDQERYSGQTEPEALDLYRRIVSQNRELEQLRDALEQAYADLRDRFGNRGNDCF